jgi:hypothetical protein
LVIMSGHISWLTMGDSAAHNLNELKSGNRGS